MATAVCLDYFYGDEVKIDSFFRLPRVLLTNGSYSKLSAETKLMYGLMLDRVALSMRNNWREDGRVYIYFTLNDAKRLLSVGKNKAVGLFKQLETLGLIHRRKQGQGKPARVFVRRFVEPPEETAEEAAPEAAEISAPEAETVTKPETAPMPEPTPEALPKPIPTPIHDVKRPAPATEEQGNQSATLTETAPAAPDGIAGLLADCAVGVRRLGDILSQRLANGGGIAASVNGAGVAAPVARTEAAGKPVYEKSAYYLSAYEGEKWRNVSLIRREIMENLDFSMIKSENAVEQMCGYMDVMVQACCEQTPTVRINGSEYSRATVRQRMYQLDATHLEYVYDCMKECAPKVRNPRAYILSALFNSYDTIDLYYETKVAHDMAESRRRVREEYGDYFDED